MLLILCTISRRLLFGRDELIHFWIGFGVLGTNNNQNKRLEDIGLDYIDELVEHGFFEKGENDDGHIYYSIHDLLHELALNISSYECLSINGVSNLRFVQARHPYVTCRLGFIALTSKIGEHLKTVRTI